MTNRQVLFIAYHYPPIAVSSGYQRTLAFSKHLKEFGWNIAVLTASNKAYEKWQPENENMIPPYVKVIKAFARDTQRQLSIKGRYFRFMALPDKWQSWIFGGIFSGVLRFICNRPDVIISTYPIASAHVIGYWLHRILRTPWVADLRDPMAQPDYPTDPLVYKSFVKIEEKIFKYASKVVLVTNGAREYYLKRYPEVDPRKLVVIENGFDEDVFVGLKDTVRMQDKAANNKLIRIVHSGIIYPTERDPTQFFNALSQLKKEGFISSDNCCVILRATGHDHLYSPRLKEFNIEDVVKLEPAISYRDALSEMFEADVLLLLQAGSCDDQIPAKAYEYIRAGRPVLALTSLSGETGTLISKVNAGIVAPLDNVIAIKEAIKKLLVADLKNMGVPVSEVEAFSRKTKAAELANLLEGIVS